MRRGSAARSSSAMLVGVPVVATTAGGIPDLLSASDRLGPPTVGLVPPRVMPRPVGPRRIGSVSLSRSDGAHVTARRARSACGTEFHRRTRWSNKRLPKNSPSPEGVWGRSDPHLYGPGRLKAVRRMREMGAWRRGCVAQDAPSEATTQLNNHSPPMGSRSIRFRSPSCHKQQAFTALRRITRFRNAVESLQRLS